MFPFPTSSCYFPLSLCLGLRSAAAGSRGATIKQAGRPRISFPVPVLAWLFWTQCAAAASFRCAVAAVLSHLNQHSRLVICAVKALNRCDRGVDIANVACDDASNCCTPLEPPVANLQHADDSGSRAHDCSCWRGSLLLPLRLCSHATHKT